MSATLGKLFTHEDPKIEQEMRRLYEFVQQLTTGQPEGIVDGKALKRNSVLESRLVNPMRTEDFGLEAARGTHPGVGREYKFGEALDCDQAPTDVWDGADTAGTGNKVWDRPDTVGETVTIAGGAADTAAGTGMQRIAISGLTSWSTKAVSEELEMNGAGGVTSANSYVIIFRKKGVRFGASGTNSAIITATGDTSGNVVAAIQAGNGQTLMAIYGVPSTQTFYMKQPPILRVLSSGPAASPNYSLLVDERADQSDSGFLVKQRFSFSDGDGLPPAEHDPPVPYPGPCILKVQVLSDVNNAQVSAAFNGYLVDN